MVSKSTEILVGYKDSRFRLAAYGKTGAGKSTLLNQLIGSNQFSTSSSLTSETGSVQRIAVKWAECSEPIELVDTVGFADNTHVRSLREVASAVTATAVGYNLALYLIAITSVRFDN